jgi:PKD repeat protein
LATVLVLVIAAVGAGSAGAYVVRGRHGQRLGLLLRPGALRFHAIAAGTPHIRYQGGPVMLTSNLHVIFWGPSGSFDPTFTNAVTQWAQGLASDSNKTTNFFSIGSQYYQTHPRRSITRRVYFGGAVLDTQPYPRGDCVNPNNNDPCMGDGQLQAEIARVIRAEHWPTDQPRNPRNQYLLFMPRNTDSCDDQAETDCTFSNYPNGFCAYHSSFSMGSNAVVYSLIPYISNCDSGQAPAGTFGNADADGALDDTTHEVMESATDPLTTSKNSWMTSDRGEVGDLCNPPYSGNNSDYGDPLGGSMKANTAFNELIGGHTYYTQAIWARPVTYSDGFCAQRAGPTADFAASASGSSVSLNGTYSYDLTGNIRTYVWYFGDGSSESTSGGHAQHTYAQPGTYQVSLIVEDASGAVNASAQTQTVVVQ